MVVIGDGVDSTNAGAPGDSNWILTELLRYVCINSLIALSVVRSTILYDWQAGRQADRQTDPIKLSADAASDKTISY